MHREDYPPSLELGGPPDVCGATAWPAGIEAHACMV